MASDQHHWLVTVALVTSSLIALIANLLLLLVFCRRRGLRTISNRFTINLLLTNFLSSALLIPLLIADQEFTQSFTNSTSINTTESIIFEEETLEQKGQVIISDLIITTNETDYNEEEIAYFNIGNILCYVAQTIVGLICTASILSVLLIGIDQYFAVIHSLRYHSYIDKFRSLVLIITSWFIAIFFGVFGAVAQSESPLWRFCTRNLKNTEKTALNTAYALTYFVFVLLVPFVAICVIYVCIYAAAHNNSERMRKSKGNSHSHSHLDGFLGIRSGEKAPSESRLNLKVEAEVETKTIRPCALPKVQSAPNFINLVQEHHSSNRNTFPKNKVTRTCSDRGGFITNLKYRLSNASVFRYREETRAAKISVLVIFMVLICYIPYGIAVVLNSNAINVKTTPLINFISLVLLILSNILSPILFAYRNRRIRRELLRFLGFTSSKNPVNNAVTRSIIRPKLVTRIIEEECDRMEPTQPFLSNERVIPQVVITCKVENEQTEKPSILKRVCSTKNWPSYKKCSFITVPESCWQTESARGSFSSASTQMSTDD